MKDMDGMDEQVILAQEKKQDREWEEGEGAWSCISEYIQVHILTTVYVMCTLLDIHGVLNKHI